MSIGTIWKRAWAVTARWRGEAAPLVLAGALAFAISSPATTAAASPSELTTRQMEALAPKEADRVARQDLLSVLEPIDHISSGMFRQLRGVDLSTRPFGTEFDGLCRRDVVSLLYAPINTAALPSDRRLRPLGVEASPLFRALRAPTAPSPDRSLHRPVWSAECAGLDEDNDALWFGAPSALDAARGANLLLAAITQLRAARLTPKGCSHFPTADKCQAAILKAATLTEISNIDGCGASTKAFCYVIQFGFGGVELTIEGDGAPDVLVPTQVDSVEYGEFFIVT